MAKCPALPDFHRTGRGGSKPPASGVAALAPPLGELLSEREAEGVHIVGCCKPRCGCGSRFHATYPVVPEASGRQVGDPYNGVGGAGLVPFHVLP